MGHKCCKGAMLWGCSDVSANLVGSVNPGGVVREDFLL